MKAIYTLLIILIPFVGFGQSLFAPLENTKEAKISHFSNLSIFKNDKTHKLEGKFILNEDGLIYTIKSENNISTINESIYLIFKAERIERYDKNTNDFYSKSTLRYYFVSLVQYYAYGLKIKGKFLLQNKYYDTYFVYDSQSNLVKLVINFKNEIWTFS